MEYVTRKEVGDYKITMFHEEEPEEPWRCYELVGNYAFKSWCNRLTSSNYLLDGEYYEEALKELVMMYLPQKDIISYINKYSKEYALVYNKSDRVWDYYQYGEDRKYYLQSFKPQEIKSDDYKHIFLEDMEVQDLEQMLYDCKSIAFTTWSSRGYCQGDCVNGFAFCDKNEFKKHFEGIKDWRNRAVEAMLKNIDDYISKWLWGDVLRFTLEEKQTFTKHYDNPEKQDESGFEWELIDEGNNVYDDADDFVDYIVKEYQLIPA